MTQKLEREERFKENCKTGNTTEYIYEKISVERKRNNDGAGAGREICESNVLEWLIRNWHTSGKVGHY